MARTSDAGKRADWESRLRRYRAGGLAVGAYCTATSQETAKPAADRAVGGGGFEVAL
ncbi:MAG: hypothetical protein U0939_24235 [Pirellulales bacterium]